MIGDWGRQWPLEEPGLGDVGLDCHVGDIGPGLCGREKPDGGAADVGSGDGGIGDSGVVEKYRTLLPGLIVRFLGDLGDLGEPRGDGVMMPGFRFLGVLLDQQIINS